MAESRIYVVTQNGNKKLVKALNKNAAINFIAKNGITAEVAGQDELLALVAAGVTVEDSTVKAG